VGVRGLQRPAPNVRENLRHWGLEGHKKGRQTRPLRYLWEGNADNTVSQSVEVLHSKPLGVPVGLLWTSDQLVAETST